MAALLKIVPQLKEVGYDNWLKALQIVAYSEEWYDEDEIVLENENGWQPSDFDASLQDKDSKRHRKVCFTLMYKTCRFLEHFFEDVKLGDVIAAYKNITAVYNRKTTAGFVAASRAFSNSSMQVDHVDLCEFIALVASRAKRVRSLGGKAAEAEKISVLLGGLLPEFKAQKTIIQSAPIDTLRYATVSNDLTDFAITEEIYLLKTGGSKGAAKTYAAVADTGKSCRNWDRDGKCSYGDECKFNHNGQGGKGMADIRLQRNGKGGKGGKGGKRTTETCGHCSKSGHNEAQCFAKANKKMSPGTRTYLAHCLEDRKDRKRGRSRSRSSSPTRRKTPRTRSRGLSPSPTRSESPRYHTFMIRVRMPACYFSGDSLDRSKFIADGGSNKHATNDSNDFVEGSTYPVDIRVDVGGGATPCTLMGDVMCYDMESKEHVLLTDAMFLPKCAVKIVSESQLDKAGYALTKPGDGTCIVTQPKTGRQIMRAEFDASDMYQFKNLKVVSNHPEAPLCDAHHPRPTGTEGWDSVSMWMAREHGIPPMGSTMPTSMLPRRSVRLQDKENWKRAERMAESGTLPMPGQADTMALFNLAVLSQYPRTRSSSSSTIKEKPAKGADGSQLKDSKPYELRQAAASFNKSFKSLVGFYGIDKLPLKAYATRAPTSSSSSSSISSSSGNGHDVGQISAKVSEFAENDFTVKGGDSDMGRKLVKCDASQVDPAIIHGKLVTHQPDNCVLTFHQGATQVSKVSGYFNNVKVAKSYMLMEDNGRTEAERVLLAHMQCGHFGMAEVRRLLGLKISKGQEYPICHSCEIMRATMTKFTHTLRPRADAALRRLWIDIGFGKMSKLIFQVVLDDHTRMCWVSRLKDKSETLSSFITLQRRLENEKHPRKVAAIARDNDPAYSGHQWVDYASDHGIQLEPNGPYRKETPIERAMQTIGGGARAAMHHGNAPESEMFNAIQHMVFCINQRAHASNPQRKSPMSMWAGVTLKMSSRVLRGVLFCLCYGYIYPERRSKNEPRAFAGIFKGCNHFDRAFKVTSIQSGKTYTCVDVKMVPSVMPYRQNLPGQLTEHDANYVDMEPESDEGEELPLASSDKLQRLGKATREMSAAALEKFSTYAAHADFTDAEMAHKIRGLRDPLGWSEALQRVDAQLWMEAGGVEDSNHKENKTWKLVDRSCAKGCKIFWPKPVFKVKWLPPDLDHPEGAVDKHKVRLTIAAFKTQLIDGVDFREKYAATPRWNSIRLMLAIACYFDLELELNDVVAFFLTAYLEENEVVFMEQPESSDDGSGRICQLLRSMYGLPQAAYHAQRKLMLAFKADKLDQCVSDRAVVVLAKAEDSAPHAAAICSVHVDDNFSTGTNDGIKAVRASLKKSFKTTTNSKPALVIGVQVERSRPHRWLKVHFYGYVMKLLEDQGMLESTPSSP
jgi:hypothetical protein